MPVLMIVVASVLVFVATLIMLAVAAVAEYGQMRRMRFDPSARPFTLTLTEAFDPEHAVLWISQVPALMLIRAAGDRGVSYGRLQHVYQQAERRYPELYDGSSFSQWVFFLERSQIVSLGAYRVRMTAYGREFLKHCASETTLAA